MPGPNLKLVWSPTALNELASIWAYLAGQASDAVAGAQIQRISSRCDVLKRLPFSGRARDELKPGLRAILVPPYVVLYRVFGEGVQIMHVVHSHRDIAAILMDDD